MIVYRVGISPAEYEGEGEDHDEFFSSLKVAKARRAELIKGNPTLEDNRYSEDFEIERIKVANLPRRDLILAILNGEGWVEERATIVPPYKPKEIDEQDG